MRRPLLLLPLLLLPLTGCAGSSPKPAAAKPATPAPAATAPAAAGSATASPACQAPPDAVLPHTDGSLAETDHGTYCLAPGGRLTVFLTTAGPTGWSSVHSSAPAVLAAAQDPVTAPIGVTAGLFAGATPGTAELTSQDGSGHSWRVTIVVR
ncbi:hypothetical protein P3T35_006869 [Kitasatospora sp. GP30]|uniref:hypothetical protein n=1 Tax=Kitasatospora sp. GP30 TaxID=3035084 RepID=UPI000C70F9CC|nr:hypothetical protein [Kitasatospora sp. GP30]MDH6144820.1 hypothetical protein [Kitasatospora sp. GP30]